MTVDDLRIRARHELEQLGLSVESAAYLVDERPRGGWDALVTTEELDLKLEALEQRVIAKIAGVRTEIAAAHRSA